MKQVQPVPCQHIADYYAQQPKSIGRNLLLRGYQQFSNGAIEGYFNNLFRPTIHLVNE